MKHAKLSTKTIKKILKCFCIELTTVQTAELLGLNRHTIDRYYLIFREKILEYQEENLSKLSGDIEIDESYFGSRHKLLTRFPWLVFSRETVRYIHKSFPMLRVNHYCLLSRN